MHLLDRRSILPLYYQLAQVLRSQMTTGEIHQGDKLPSERDLMQTYQLSRNTVRQAIDLLVDEGLVYQDHGRGNYTFGPDLDIQYRIDTFVEHYELLKRIGTTPTVHHIGTKQMPAPEAVRKALKLQPKEEVVRFIKIFKANEQPAILSYDYISSARLPEEYNTSGAGQAFLPFLEEHTGSRVEFSLSEIIPVTASKEVAQHLGLARGSAVLLLRETFLDPGKNTHLAVGMNFYHPEIFHFRILRRRE